MKKILLIILAGIILSGCYTTLYPPVTVQMQNATEVPDSARQVIINNYYETTEYYQMPHYQRYSLLWGDYYWDPFYYDYTYYNWRPYYWYGSYYYYNPHNHYWYYYHHDNYGQAGPSNNRGDQERIHKPGYNQLMNSPSGSAPYIAVQNSEQRLQKVGKVGIEQNTNSKNDGVYSPRLESVGKSSVGSNQIYKSDSNSSDEGYKAPSTTSSTEKSSSTSNSGSYKPKSASSSSSSNSSGSNKSNKSSRTKSTSSKNSNTSSSSSSSKKSQ